MEKEYRDLKTSDQRMKGFKKDFLSIARAFVFLGVAFMAVMMFTTIMANKATAETNYKIAHAFMRVH